MVLAQYHQYQCNIYLEYHQIYPQMILLTLVEYLTPHHLLSGTGHKLFSIKPFIGIVYNVYETFS